MPIYSTTDMPIYALVSLLLLNITITDSTKCAAYTDDISCVAKLRNILTWWNNRIFSWQIVKPEKYETAKGIFKDTNLKLTNKGKRHLGAVVGTEEFRKEYVTMIVYEQVAKLKLLSEIAKFYPQAAYCAFTLGFRQNFN